MSEKNHQNTNQQEKVQHDTSAPIAGFRNASVTFGKTIALDGVSADFGPGLIHGLIGRNGAGKTTLLSLLASYRQPNSGAVLVQGGNPFEDAQRMGIVHFVYPRNVSDETDTVKETLEW